MLAKVLLFVLRWALGNPQPAIRDLLKTLLPDMPEDVRNVLARKIARISLESNDPETVWFEINDAIAQHVDQIPEVLR
jgi:hypothetical protein